LLVLTAIKARMTNFRTNGPKAVGYFSHAALHKQFGNY
jgi:hypothetical protein